MSKTSRTWGDKILSHTYPPNIIRNPRLISLVYLWNRSTQLRNWYVRSYLKRLIRSLPPDFTLLDVGSGEGMYLFPFARKFPRAQFEGIDKAASHIQFCHLYRECLRQGNVSLCMQEVEYLDRPQEAHIVLCVGVLQYIEEDELVLENLFRVLKPGAKCLLYVPVHGAYVIPGFKAYYEGKMNYEKRQARKRIYSPEKFLHLVHKAGFLIDETRNTYGFWGKWTYEIYTYFLSLVLHGPLLGKILGGIGMFLFLPIQWMGMTLDFCLPIKKGNGLLVIARK